ncbi:hypothetical protein M5K25_011809 [Dendrobium thyrsiflorum]|uniref:Uncharacterized protein n=1 Tax=Dendrobium thyrsiflorum TaxID=117978 RepID=A0ABD0V453_DENTH
MKTLENTSHSHRFKRGHPPHYTSPKSEVSCLTSLLLCMADPEQDHKFVYNDQGQIDVFKSPFFNVNLEIDQTVEDYADRIIFSLAAAIEEQLAPAQWQIISKPYLHSSFSFPNSSEINKRASLHGTRNGVNTGYCQLHSNGTHATEELTDDTYTRHVLDPLMP